MAKVWKILFAVVLLGFSFGVTREAEAGCYSYTNSRPAWLLDQTACAFTGSGCMECIFQYSWGYTACQYGENDTVFCTDYQF